MGLLHIPRVVVASARGYLRGRLASAPSAAAASDSGSIGRKEQSQSATDHTRTGDGGGRILGIGPANQHVYRSRVGLFDVDVNMHMNHASYLTHAELARWQLMAENGSMPKMFRDGLNFFVTGCAVRYRKEIGPLFRGFEIRTHVASIDRRNMWLYHTFHYPGDNGGQSDKSRRVLAQILVQAVCVRGRTVVSPRKLLGDTIGVDDDTLARLSESFNDDMMHEKRSRFEELEEVLRDSAALEDDK